VDCGPVEEWLIGAYLLSKPPHSVIWLFLGARGTDVTFTKKKKYKT
jgi:hypothetical protein